MNPTIRIGLAGFGLSAQVFHLPFWQADGRFQLRRAFERNGKRAEAACPGIDTVRDFTGLLADDIDLVVITTPNQTHFDFARQALLAGKHVLVEKPLCSSAAEARELAALAEQQGVLLAVYQNRRWDSAVLTAKQLLADKALGEIVDCEIRFERYAAELNKKAWKETGEAGVGLLYDLGVHLVDMAVEWFGKLPAELYADIRHQHPGALSDDYFQLQLYYADGKKVVLCAGRYMREPLPFLTLHGRQGSYIKHDADNQEPLLVGGASIAPGWNSEAEAEWGLLHTERDGRLIRQRIPSIAGDYGAFYRNLYEALHSRAPLAVTAHQAARVLEILEKARQSAHEGRRIPL